MDASNGLSVSKPDASLPLLASMTILGIISVTLYVPSLPAMTAALATTAGAAQLTMTVFLVGFAFAQLVYGPLSDRIGRRPAVVGGLLIFIAASLLAALSNSIDMLIVARAVQAVGACAGPVLARAIVRDTTSGPDTARWLAAIGSVLAIAPTFGLALGGLSQELLGWRGCFLLLAVMGAAVLLWTLVALPETNRQPLVSSRPAAILGDYLTLLTDRTFLAYVICGAAIISGAYVWHSGSSFLFVDLIGLSPGVFGLLGLFTGAFYFTGTVLARRYAGRVDPRTLTRRGCALALFGSSGFLVLMLAGVIETAPILIILTFYSLGLGLISPTTAAASLARHPTTAGAASAVFGFAQMALSGVAVSLLASVAPRSPTALAAFLTVISLLGLASCSLLFIDQDRESAP